MPYEHIPGIGASYLDGAFRTLTSSSQPRILVFGGSEDGIAYSLFAVNSVGDAESEFGSDSELMKPLHEALEQGADNVALMRVGGRRGRLIITDDGGGSLEIYPERRDNDALDRYSLIITNDTSENRILVFDREREIFVYDSDEVEVLDTGLVEVKGDLSLCEIGSDVDPLSGPTLGGMIPGSVNYVGVEVATIATQEDGDDGVAASKMSRYHALEQAYQFIDYEDADILIPVGIHVDDLNQADEGNGGAGMDFSAFASGNTTPDAGDADDGLGYLWKFLYRGKPYCVFFENPEPFDDGLADGALTTELGIGAGDLIAQPADGFGDLGSILALEVTDAGVGVASTMTITAESNNTILVSCAVDLTGIQYDTLHGLLDAIPGFDDIINITASSGVAVNPVAPTQFGADQRVILTNQLDGEVMPLTVVRTLLEADDAEIRHVNFAHQLAYACRRASTTWSTMLGCISTTEPEDYSRAAVAEWVGQEPAYSYTGTDLTVADNADEGENILGHMLHAGMYNYRSHKVSAATADEGYAYGGYILTQGDSLPTSEPYGIEDDDEALDAKGEAIDIGKFLLVCASYPILSNSFDGGTQYRGSLCGTLAGKVAITPENEEPIGINGIVRSIRRPPRMRTPLINSLAKLRFVTTRREEGLGHILVSVKTAAHPDSDYTRLSTIRSVNREITGIRNICKPYIGKEFSSTRLASLQTSINGFLKAEKEAGFNQGAIAALSYTRADKIMGRLTVKLKMIPPFSIEAITIETTLAAEESELTT